MPGKRFSDEFCKAIYSQRDEGFSIRQIAKLNGIHFAQVQRLLKRRIGNTLEQRTQKRGRPRATTASTDGRILLSAKLHRFSANGDIARQFGVSRETIRSRLAEKGYLSRLAVRNPLTPRHMKARYQWCLRHVGQRFRHWLFSEEVCFELADCSAVQHSYVPRTSGEKFKPQ